MDASPRGDPAGLVHVMDARTLLIPDRRGNNRADSLRDIIHDPRVALLFLIPGVGETLQVNGRAMSRRPGPAGALQIRGRCRAGGALEIQQRQRIWVHLKFGLQFEQNFVFVDRGVMVDTQCGP